ncbi:MAG: DUF3604 domain-containing protein [Parachlamydiaceae bacterium]|nr:DUF3604 domain-containing protein [Parachlamydiaceae bacterium]
MRRSICYCEPNQALAGEIGNWNYVYTSATTLPKGTRFKFDIASTGRDVDWEIPTANLKKTDNVIYGVLENGKSVQATEVVNPNSFAPDFEFVLPQELEAGSSFTIVMGSPPGKGKKAVSETGTRAQCNAQRRRPFYLYIDTTGKRNFDEAEMFSIDIKGNKLNSIRLLTPSFVVRNKRFDIIVRFEDEYGNLTSSAPEDTMVELSHEHLRENLKWKLFVPETGFIALPNLYFNELGVYTIQLRNVKTKETFRSSPIKCFSENNRHLFWGLLHGESERIDSTENVESCLRHFRDDRALNFYSSSPFESQEETPNEVWKHISQNMAEFDEADRFSTFLGFQWEGEAGEEGVRLMLFNKDNKPILRKKDPKYNALKKIYKSFSPKELLSIPCFTMGKGFEYDFKDYNPQFERVVEIYNAWGSSEYTKKEGNTRPITSGKKGVQESAEGSVQKALQRNCRFGFVSGGLDDRGIYNDFFEGDQEQYSPGLTAIIAPEHSRTVLLEALYNRSCYATTGERIILGLYLAGFPMGSEVSTANKPGLVVNRHLSGYVAGTTDLESVEIIRNGKVIKSFDKIDGYSLDFTFDDLTSLDKVALQDKENKKAPPFVYYYLKVTQEDGHIAWSSPIWVDLLPPSKDYAPKRPLKAAKAAPVMQLPPEEEGDVVDDFDDEDEDDLE